MQFYLNKLGFCLFKLRLSVVILGFLVACVPSDQKNFMATVNSVHDGDTVRVTDQYGQKQRIRLAFIDAPEKEQAYGLASRDALKALIDHEKVHIQVIDTDQYGRTVARIVLDGQDINLVQVQQGHAWHYRSIAKKNQEKSNYVVYERAQAEAKRDRRGLWAGKKPIAPWSFRYQKRHDRLAKPTE